MGWWGHTPKLDHILANQRTLLANDAVIIAAQKTLQLSVNTIIEKENQLMASVSVGFTDLTNAVNALVAEEGSVVTAIQALQAQVVAGSPVTGDQLEALATQVQSATSGLAAAIAPPPTPAP